MIKNEDTYIKLYISHAKAAFKDAQILANNRRWSGCANHLYYACFHCITGLLYKYKINPKTHKGLDMQFHLHFIKTGKMPKEYGDLFADLMRMRNDSDYGEWQDLTEKNVKPLIPMVKKFISDLEKLIKE